MQELLARNAALLVGIGLDETAIHRQVVPLHCQCKTVASSLPVHGLPVAVCVESATPHEVKLATSTLVQMIVPEAPQNLIGDNAYDSDKLDAELRRYGIELIAPHRRNRRNTTQDLRRMRRYRRRWKIERLFAWLQNFRRLVVRYERYAENFLGMLYLGCCLILLRHI